MQWKGRRESSRVDDARQSSGGSLPGGANGLGLLLGLARIVGFKGMLVALVIGGILWKAGIIDPSMFLSGTPSATAPTGPASALEQERFDFAKVVLADTEDVWTSEFSRLGREYSLPVMTVFRGRVQTGCGQGAAEMGPFYCPADEKIYIDLGFYDELERTFEAPGDFAQAYVIAHEVGHHVQKLLGTSEKVAAMRGRPDYNEYSVRLELQADYFAGVWAHHSARYLEHGDIEEAIRAANAIGDDAIQLKTRGKVVPHAFTHGTSEQRTRWFVKGLRSGKMEEGDTFSQPYDAL